jgi:hypothetical protein
MPCSCTICTHPQRTAIETALVAGDAFRMMAKRFGTSPAALFRHKEHLTKMPSTTRPSAHSSTGDNAPQALTLARELRLFPTITHPKKRAFLAAFVRCGRRIHAATQAKIDVRSHFWWMQTDPAYAEAFGQAEQMAADMAADEAFRRGIEGVEEGVWYKGARRHSDEVQRYDIARHPRCWQTPEVQVSSRPDPRHAPRHGRVAAAVASIARDATATCTGAPGVELRCRGGNCR